MNTWSNSMSGQREAFQRSLAISGAGSVLLQTSINKIVQLLTLREFGVQGVLDRRPGAGNAAYINRRTAGSSGGVWVSDTFDAANAEETGSYAQTSFTYRTLLSRGRVSRVLQAKGRSYGDVLATELNAKLEDFGNSFEIGLCRGDTNSVAGEVNGLLTLINAVSGQVVANTTAAAGDVLSLAKLDKTIDLVKGSARRDDLVIFGSHLACRKLNSALQAQQRFNDSVEVRAGFRVRAYDGIPIVVTTGLNDALVWSGSSITGFTTGDTTSLVVVNRRYMWIEELTPLTIQPMAQTTSQYDEFDLYWDGALVFANTKGAAIYAGLTTL